MGLLKLGGATVFVLAFAGVLEYFIGNMVGWLLACIIVFDFIDPSSEALAPAIVISLTAICCFLYYGGIVFLRLCGSAGDRIQVAVEDSFIEKAWASFKEKTCVQVEIK